MSLKSLLALAFSLAMLPMVLAVIYSGLALRETADAGEKAIYQVVEETKVAREILQRVGDIERKARLFIVLADLALPQPYERESYENVRRQFQESLAQLLSVRHDQRMALLANELSEKEQLIHDQIMAAESKQKIGLSVDEAFDGLHEAGAALWQEASDRVDRKVGDLHDRARSEQQGLMLKGVLLLLVSLVSGMGLLALLNRSIRQLDDAIRRLGTGEFAQAIAVAGPRDLRYLGDRLEWLRTRLLALEESKQQFMRNVSEGFLGPIEGIREATTALQAGSGPEPVEGKSLAHLNEQVERLGALFEEVIEYNRINENTLEQGAKVTVNMKDLLDAVIEDYGHRLQAKALTLKALIQPVAFYGMPDQLRTLVDNLVSNAVKFTPEGGEIRIILRAGENSMILEVEDDGPGIEAGEARHLFEPFYRGKAAAALGTEGSGLGLAIVSECVANHQGRVEILEPRQDETGARFRVELPLSETT